MYIFRHIVRKFTISPDAFRVRSLIARRTTSDVVRGSFGTAVGDFLRSRGQQPISESDRKIAPRSRRGRNSPRRNRGEAFLDPSARARAAREVGRNTDETRKRIDGCDRPTPIAVSNSHRTPNTIRVPTLGHFGNCSNIWEERVLFQRQIFINPHTINLNK